MVKIGVRARAVDLLGRQQIAGIPTAIHELFKNAHDAYAERVEVDFFRKQKLLVLRDDGYGMTRQDVEKRWLTLGTESRVGANKDEDVWTGPKDLPRRAIMGEKGIGRLAIAVIAPLTLLLTRAARPDGKSHNLVVALVHWGIFEQPGLELQQIDVPIKEFPSGTLPTRNDVNELVVQVRENLKALKAEISEEEFKKLNESLDLVTVNPDQLDQLLASQSQRRGASDEAHLSLRHDVGTHFVLMPTAPELVDDIDGGADQDATFVERSLLGFSNTMTDAEPPISTSFRDHRLDGSCPDLIGRSEFFSKEDLESLDQYFEGEVDEFGQFVGTVRVYGNEPQKYVCNWPQAKGRRIRCGKFRLRFGYLMGNPHESLLAADRHRELKARCDRYGGMYIYRDNIRILPYGNSDFDFLDVERARAKSAKDAFFSFRRMAGYIALSHENNSSLNEKAGREGFRQNQAYREFVAILKNLLKRLASDYFRRGGDESESFWELKDKFDAEFKAAQKQKKSADKKREELRDELERYFARVDDSYFEKQAEWIKNNFEKSLLVLDPELDPADFSVQLSEIRRSTYGEIGELEALNRVSKPSALSIRGRLASLWSTYNRVSLEVRDESIVPLKEYVAHELNRAGKAITAVYRAEQASQELETKSSAVIKSVASVRNEAYQATEAFKNTLRQTVKSEFSEFRAQLMQGLEEFVRAANSDPENIESVYQKFQDRISEIELQQAAQFAAIRDQMKSLSEDLGGGYTADTRAYIWEQRAERLEEQLEFYQDYAQMGMGLGILQHEFTHVAADFREAMQAIKPWADRTPGLDNAYSQLRSNFESLDGYLKVLDPLGRRLNRSKVKISGDNIYLFLMRLFGPRLEENSIELIPTTEFRKLSVECKSSTLLTAFTNIVDNAIYWLMEGATGQRNITLGADESGFLISNSGPGIPAADSDRIFEFGESRKEGGTGLGLSISKNGLKDENMDLILLRNGEDTGPTFKICTVVEGEL
ncbi:ATP-binding protein [Kordiimonas lacus]|uniref:histidine kinase n=1 Tax=Kordiimonas lacus TaxID=637679 RepID=A0A1G6U7F9_9PROT|nr:ATP-binding protein [Kordiimonas lacus]SDD36527.1 Signal transduction histidine kinase [Kordiimonas lacus]